jgi:hypothetical protein
MCIICTASYEKLAIQVNINCHECPYITTIPDLPNLLTLNCWNCQSLTSISNNLYSLRVLDCAWSPISYLPYLPSLQCLYCDGCPITFFLDLLPNLHTLDCLNIPQDTQDYLANKKEIVDGYINRKLDFSDNQEILGIQEQIRSLQLKQKKSFAEVVSGNKK